MNANLEAQRQIMHLSEPHAASPLSVAAVRPEASMLVSQTTRPPGGRVLI